MHSGLLTLTNPNHNLITLTLTLCEPGGQAENVQLFYDAYSTAVACTRGPQVISQVLSKGVVIEEHSIVAWRHPPPPEM